MDGGGGASAHRGDVLVVDDHAAIRELVREVLEGVGYTVREAADGAGPCVSPVRPDPISSCWT